MAPKLILLLFLLLNFSSASAVITDADLNLAILTLRAHNYNLIGNAIATTDLRYKLLSSSSVSSFTILSPPDAALYSLDMASPASAYVQSLHYHLLPTRLPFSLLLNASRAHTLLPNFDLFFSRVNSSVFVNGVALVGPDLFLGPSIAVHALDGILVPGELGFDAAAASSVSPPPIPPPSPSLQSSPPPPPPSNPVSPPPSVQSSPPSPPSVQSSPPSPPSFQSSPPSPPSVQTSPPSPPSVQSSPPPPPSVQSSPPPPPTNHIPTAPSNVEKIRTPPPQSHSQMTPEIENRRRREQTGRSQGRRRPGPGRNGELSKANEHFPDL